MLKCFSGMAGKFVALLIFWFIMSGSMDWQHVVVGAGASILIIIFWKQTSAGSLKNYNLLKLPKLLGFLGMMLVDVCQSAWHVAWIILSGSKVEPKFIWITTPLKSPLARVMLANCITLTPGTLTVSLVEERLLVHALTPKHAEALQNWRVHRALVRMEEK